MDCALRAQRVQKVQRVQRVLRVLRVLSVQRVLKVMVAASAAVFTPLPQEGGLSPLGDGGQGPFAEKRRPWRGLIGTFVKAAFRRRLCCAKAYPQPCRAAPSKGRSLALRAFLPALIVILSRRRRILVHAAYEAIGSKY